MRNAATLRLRGRSGPVRAEVDRPPTSDPTAVLVFVGDAHGPLICRVLGQALQAVTLRTVVASAHDATCVLEWAADHADELGGDAERIVLAGLHDGAALAARLALRARDERWPPISRQLLIHPRSLSIDRSRALRGVAPVAISGSDATALRYAARLRAAGVRVAVLECIDPFTQRAADPAAEQQLGDLGDAAQSSPGLGA